MSNQVSTTSHQPRVIEIDTELIGRSEAFRIVALAHATGLPTLLVGPPGIGKTNVLLDYAKCVFNSNMQSDDLFILEVDEGTRPNEVKGNIDFRKLTEEKKFERNSPITRAKMVLINEIDKSSAGLRNSLLGIMNEKILFDGEHKVPCMHDLFVASCNVIPKDEKDSPFWDRFAIKYQMERISQSSIMNYIIGRKESNMRIHIPSEHEMKQVVFKQSALEMFVKTAYQNLTDRTISKINLLASACKYVYGITPERALIKATLLMGSKALADQLSKSIEPNELRDIRNRISSISKITNLNDIEREIERVVDLSKKAFQASIIERDVVEELETELHGILKVHPVYVQSQAAAGNSVRDTSDQTVAASSPF